MAHAKPTLEQGPAEYEDTLNNTATITDNTNAWEASYGMS